jgi:hypothetical protein
VEYSEEAVSKQRGQKEIMVVICNIEQDLKRGI